MTRFRPELEDGAQSMYEQLASRYPNDYVAWIDAPQEERDWFMRAFAAGLKAVPVSDEAIDFARSRMNEPDEHDAQAAIAGFVRFLTGEAS